MIRVMDGAANRSRSQRGLLVVVSLLAVSACSAPAMNIAEPEVGIPAQWQIADPAPVSTDLAQYWTMLGDPLLTAFVEQAILENRDLAQSAARLDQALSLIHISEPTRPY